MKKIYAHRGLSNIYIPNSIKSISSCLDKKYIDGIEIDIRMTKDKKFVLFHDGKLNGHTKLKGNINDYTLNELKKVNFKLKNIDYYNKLISALLYNKKNIKNIINLSKQNYKITTLDEVLNIINKKELLIEIKCEKLEEFDTKQFYSLIKMYTNKNILIQSFNKDILLQLHKIDNKLKLGLLLTLNKNIYIKNDFYEFYSVEYNLITKNKIDSSLLRKKTINLWTVNHYKQINKISSNTDGKIYLMNYITDNPLDIYNFLVH